MKQLLLITVLLFSMPLAYVQARPDSSETTGAQIQTGGVAHETAHCPHKARHGGRFSLALNDEYHLEGVYPSPGEFRLYFYDADSCEIPADRFSGRLLYQNGEQLLEQSEDGTHLRATLPGAPGPPVSVTAILNIPHPETGNVTTEHFSYNFYRLSKPAAAQGDRATTVTKAH